MALSFMRRHRRWLYGFLWVVIAAFVVLYIPAFQGSPAGSPSEWIARVGDRSVSVGEYQQAYQAARQEAYSRLGRQADAETLRRMGIEERALGSLISRRLLELEAERLHLSVSDAAIRSAITTSPEFQGRDGLFMGAEEVRRRLEMRGQTVEVLEASLRGSLLTQQLRDFITDGVTVTDAEAEKEFHHLRDQIRAEYVKVDTAPYRNPAAVSEADVAGHFEAHKETYRVPETRVASYALIATEAFGPRVAVTDRDIETYYQAHQDSFRVDEQFCASHIQTKVKAAPSDEGHDEAEAKELALKLQAEARAGGDFAALARRSSEDKGSASTGGDLGCFGRGRMPTEFDNAVAGLAPGEISDPIRTNLGYHVIRLASYQAETLQPLTVVKERIRAILTERKVVALMGEIAESVATALAKGKSLVEAAKGQGLAVEKSAPMYRGRPSDPLDSATLAARVFELKAGEADKEAHVVGKGIVFVALDEIRASRVPDLKEAETQVREDLIAANARVRALTSAQDLRSRAEREGLEKAAKAAGLTRKETPALTTRGRGIGDLGASQLLDDAAFSLDKGALSNPVPLRDGYAVLRILERQLAQTEEFAAQKAMLVGYLREQRREQLWQAFLREAQQRYKVDRNPEALQRILGEES